MKYKGTDYEMWDAWYLNVDDQIHGFHLKMQPDNRWNIGHVYTDDLLHFHACEDLLPPLFDDSNPADYYGKYTGCAITNRQTGEHVIYYTMREKDTFHQRIGICTSWDLEQFQEDSRCVLTPDPAVLIGYENIEKFDWNVVDCRDMLVVYDPDSMRYYGYFAAAADVGRESPVGVIAVAESTDLIHWVRQSIAYVPTVNGVVEVPDVFYLDGKWYLTVLSGADYCGRGATGDSYVSCCTVYATAMTPRGPFQEPENSLLIGGTTDSGYSCRSVLFRGKRYLLYIDRSAGGSAISLPKELKVIDGRLCACYTPLLEALRIRPLPVPEEVFGWCVEPNSFAWRTRGGQLHAQVGGFSISTVNGSYQAFRNPQCAKSLEVIAELAVSACAAGIMLYALDTQDSIAERYALLIEPEQQRLFLASGYAFRYVAARQFPFEKGRAYSIRMIAQEGQIEVYIDDVLLLQCALQTAQGLSFGLVCDRGHCEFRSIRAFELEP